MENQPIQEISPEATPATDTPVRSAVAEVESQNEIVATSNNKQVFILLGVFVAFIVILVFTFKMIDKDTEHSVLLKKEVPDIELTTRSDQPAHVSPPTKGVPVTQGTLVYDLNQDQFISNTDVMIVGLTMDAGQYNAMLDLDANGSVNIDDIKMIRTAMEADPAVFYDLNQDYRIDATDISILAQNIDAGKYNATLDFDCNGSVNMVDLAMIRKAVAQAGTVAHTPQ